MLSRTSAGTDLHTRPQPLELFKIGSAEPVEICKVSYIHGYLDRYVLDFRNLDRQASKISQNLTLLGINSVSSATSLVICIGMHLAYD